MKHLSICASAALFSFFGVSSALAAAFSLNPSLDAFVTTGPTGNLSNTNYGAAGALGISAPGSSQGEFQSVLQFNLASAKSSFDSQFGVGLWSIQSVTLQVTATAPNNPIFNSSAAGAVSISWMQNDSWTEGSGTPAAPTSTGITFSTLSNFVGSADESLGLFNYNGATTGNSSYSLKVTPLFSQDLLSGGAVSFRMFAGDTVISDLFNSRNTGTTASRPLLTVTATAVPEPAAVSLGLLALAGVCFRRRR